MPFRRIKEDAEEEIVCTSPYHNPPLHVMLAPGRYQYECPVCWKRTEVTVPGVTFSGVVE